MNEAEALTLVSNLNRAGLLPATEGQAPVWRDALSDIRYQDAVAAAKDLIRGRTGRDRWITPGDLRDGVQSLRRARIAAVPLPAPPAALTDDVAGSLRWQRAFIRAVGDGSPDAYAVACTATGVPPDRAVERPRPVAALIEQTASTLPSLPKKE